jgi:hypothetical protein
MKIYTVICELIVEENVTPEEVKEQLIADPVTKQDLIILAVKPWRQFRND